MKKLILIGILIFLMFGEVFSALNNKIIRLDGCGLKIIKKSTRVTGRRPENPHQPPHPMPVSFQITEFPSQCFGVERAYIWWIISDAGEQLTTPAAEITIPDGRKFAVPAVQAGIGTQKGYGEQFTRSFRADVTDYITGNGEYKISVNSSNDETDGITLFIAYKEYNEEPMFEGHLVMNDGLITKVGEDMSQILDDFEVCDDPWMAQAFLLASDLQVLVISDIDTLKKVDFIVNGERITVGRDFWNDDLFNTTLTKGQTSAQFGIIEKNEVRKDAYSWAVMGLYYRTAPCQECPETLDVNSTADETEICPGFSTTLQTEVIINAKINEEITYEWTSDPAGFHSTEQNPTVSPDTTTTYYVTATLGNGCLTGEEEVTVTVYPEPKADAGPDIAVCTGLSEALGAESVFGYTYEWTPDTWLSATNVSAPITTPEDDITYYLKITDRNGCIDYDTVNVTILEGKKPVIDVSGDTIACPCMDVKLDAGPDFIAYEWSNGETTREILISESGDYFVTATNESGCRATSDTVTITIRKTAAELGIPDKTGEPGDTINLPLLLLSGKDLDLCDLTDYYYKISFNKSVMAPLNKNFSIQDSLCVIEYNGTRISDNDTIDILQMMVTWGNLEIADIRIETFYWEKCPPEYVGLDTAMLMIEGLCHEGGATRLFYLLDRPLMKVSPNPVSSAANLEYKLTTDGYHEIFIMDMLGRKVEKIFTGMVKKGEYKANIDVNSLTNGHYFIILNAPNGTVSRNLEVGK